MFEDEEFGFKADLKLSSLILSSLRLENVSDLFPFEWDDAKPELTEKDLELMAEQRRKMDAQVIAEYNSNGRKWY